MPKPVFHRDRCKGCALCVDACPKHIIHMSKEINRIGYFYADVEDPDQCTGCRLCAVSCPDVGIQVMGKKKGS